MLTSPEELRTQAGTVDSDAAAHDASKSTPELVQSSGAPRRWTKVSTVTLFGACIGFVFLMSGLASLGSSTITALALVAITLAFISFTLISLFRAFDGIVTIVRVVRGTSSEDPSQTIVAIVGNSIMTAVGALFAFLSTIGFSRGRQLRRAGTVLLPELRRSPDWTLCALSDATGSAPDGVADQWRENGKTEHASVAAFARLTLDLMALGAPPSLITAANQDALDEIRHTELCFSLARSLDGRAFGPAAFPEAQDVKTLPRIRTLALAKLAVDSLVDGALHEGVSARIIAKLAKRAEVKAIREILAELAADEGRHAAHGWEVVRWCVDQGGKPVAHALEGAASALPDHMNSELPAPAINGAWEPWGIHGSDLESQEYSAAVSNLRARVRALVEEVFAEAA